ncbi:MAG: HD domain-containing phosphohydrolase [Myxococcota bacterium]|nr:HD domain-containing phosphohydrolase [Myxococcota bacterium]
MMTNQIDLVEWLAQRLVGADVRIEHHSKTSARVIGDSGQIALFTTEPTLNIADRQIPVILVGTPGDEVPNDAFTDVVDASAGNARVARIVSVALELFELRRIASDQQKGLKRREWEVAQLIETGKSLSAVRDVDQLLALILKKARFLAGADAGSIYVVEGDRDDPNSQTLKFKLSQNDSLSYESSEFTMPVDMSSIAGAAILKKETINIGDVRAIPEDTPYKYDPRSDARTGYHTRSVLAVPMINQVGEVLGVVQLINKKKTSGVQLRQLADFDREVVPMDAACQALVETLASQAGIAIETAFLYEEIQRIFDGFIRASVHAIEQRDPTTSGHSFRVARLTRRLAEVVMDTANGPYAETRFTNAELKEIETAAMLHDFGKIGVREEVLVKAKKLYAPTLKMIRSRFDFIRRSIENDHLHRRLMMIEEGAPKEELDILDQACERAVTEIEDCWRIIRSANEPTVLPDADFERIKEIAKRSYFDIGGQRQGFLTSDEVTSLQIARGSLTSEELSEIRSHAAHTISFLTQIPWSKAMRSIPEYAGAHHEKLDGSGYPKGIKGNAIPIPAKMMAVADIFDALTASDRPYKKAVPVARALDILGLEAKDKHIDQELVRLFKESEVYRILEVR